ncbi:cytochrome b/b6 domain-containing protein [Plectonema cf. radiosum LEGE 06105]|uniref:Cytochrome b/b6 domain-containing protein n=1 Tax=Plectonema cf. radiosum LEGE 06105 TaxID=945769 RepID=A0A8J7FBU9_9CYAN|nr:cytochrome b/b6 domain-containing protein [Plectonema radiosum]MBE9213383.1 cytochrome b/b6 domain-containing protein [Plectonema cf. radiosum LEGE 06105]
MSGKLSKPYQPLLLRVLHGLTGLFAILAVITAFWTYDVYDGRWGQIPLPKWTEIEGIHGTFGLWTLLIFPLFAIYAFHRGQSRLIQSDSLSKLTRFGQPIWWYTLHRLVNTLSILALTFAVYSGKMMNEKWLPQGELNHSWYYAHLISWLVLVSCIALHLLMSIKVGGVPLILSMINWRFRSKDSPNLWRKNIANWRSDFDIIMIKQWLSSLSLLKIIEIFVLITIVLAWIISLVKEVG